MEITDYWQVHRNGTIWTDWIETEEEAQEHIDKCIEDGFEGSYKIFQMKEDGRSELSRLLNNTN